jgi:hypothetical protein
MGCTAATEPVEQGSDDPGGQGGEPTADASPTSADGGPTPPGGDLGEGDGTDVVTIGDSYMRLPNQLQQPGTEGVELSLEEAGGRTYRKFGFTGVSLFPPTAVAILNGIIPGQLTRAAGEDPDIMTVVAIGGGNDLSEDCNGPTSEAELSATCIELLDQIEAGIQTLIADMGAAGVQDLVWVGYGDTTATGQRVFLGALDYLRTRRMASCTAASTPRCHYVDNKARPGLVTRDGFHPDAAGYDLVGQAVWDRMVAEGVRR